MRLTELRHRCCSTRKSSPFGGLRLQSLPHLPLNNGRPQLQRSRHASNRQQRWRRKGCTNASASLSQIVSSANLPVWAALAGISAAGQVS